MFLSLLTSRHEGYPTVTYRSHTVMNELRRSSTPLAPASLQIGELGTLTKNDERATNGPPSFSYVSPSSPPFYLAEAFTPNRSPNTYAMYIIIYTSNPLVSHPN